MERSESIKELSPAMAKAQAAIKPALKDSVNPHFKSKYADISAVMQVINDPLACNGLWVSQDVVESSPMIYWLVTTITHNSGEWISGKVPMIGFKGDMQGIGSAITYARRYGLCAMLGVVADVDDDGNASMPQQRQLAPSQTHQKVDTAPKVSTAMPPQKTSHVHMQSDPWGSGSAAGHDVNAGDLF